MSQGRNSVIEVGSLLGPHHWVENILGEGSFGVVAKCRDTRTNKTVAIKVNKPEPKVFHQTRVEIDNLRMLRDLDPETAHIIDWQDFFFHGRNICMTFELLDIGLDDYMRYRQEGDRCPGLPLTEVKAVLHQMSSALSHLSSVGMVHADIKPENIMVVDRNEKPIKFKMIDFGLSLPVSDCTSNVCAGTLPYMAPEMILGAPFNEAIDMWSLGQTAVEVITGFLMYDANTPYDVMRCIVETQGQPPDFLLDRGTYTERVFRQVRNGSQWVWKFKTPEDINYNPVETREFFLRSLDDLLDIIQWQRGQHKDHDVLLDLIKKMLSLDPRQRIKPLEVLQHPFLTGSPPQSSCEVVSNSTNNNEGVIAEDQWGPEDQTAGPEEERIQTGNPTQAEEPEDQEFMIQPENSQPEEHKQLGEEDQTIQTASQVEEPLIQPEIIFQAEENEEKESVTQPRENALAEEIEDGPIWIERGATSQTEEPESLRVQVEEVQPERRKRVGFFRRVLNRIRNAFRSSKRSKSPK